MSSETRSTRIEHALDTRSVGLAVWLYRRTRGRVTRLWRRRAIVLTTTGRRTGRTRTVLVQVFPDGPDLYVVAANSGLARPPGWYFNLLAEPHALGELDGSRLDLHAELLSQAEAAARWQQVLAVAPDYDRYRRRLGRIPPLFRLVRDGPEPSPARPGATSVATKTHSRVTSLHNLAVALGVLAGIGGAVHGVGELLQGAGPPNGVVFDSWTRGGIAANLGGEPAMTLVPNLVVTGILSMAASTAVAVWALAFLDRPNSGRGLVGLSVVMLLVGGGFGPPLLGMLAGLVAGAAHSRSVFGSRHGRAVKALAATWPVLFWLCLADAAFLVLGSLIAGVVLNVDISDAFVYGLFLAVVGVPLAALAGMAHDSLAQHVWPTSNQA
jgi:deazaflavin-dependent oxidoreductase (nitroreductase family)